MFGPWWACLLALSAATALGWLLCAVMTMAHRADIATGDEPQDVAASHRA